MDKLQRSVAESLDGSTSSEIFPYLPYIFQDFWELGTDPVAVVQMVTKNIGTSGLKILDAGCGKGAVAIRLAEAIDCRIFGIDGMPAFIDEARKYASLLNLSEKCVFEVADIRVNIAHFSQLDLVILGAVGQVLGNMGNTIAAIRSALKPGGFLLINDGLLPDDSTLNDNRYLKKSQFYDQIISSHAEIIEERIFDRAFFNSQNNEIFTLIKKRVDELSETKPQLHEIFRQYLDKQQHEMKMMTTGIISGMWLLRL
ncbi:MAG: class I SAM-dependent methyltransferase [Sphingobacteriia bacterium]|nr:class I SAM-dependent methyltransferase [Sphingobacteriia bacterium]